MKTFAIASGLICTTILCSVGNPAEAANLVINGGFEEPGLDANTWKYFGAGEVPGWTPFEGSTIEIRNNVAGDAYEGGNFAELDSHAYDKNADAIGFFQDIVTEIGKEYKFSFAYGPREQKRVDGDNLFSASFGSFNEEFDAGNSTDGWQLFSKTITAVDTTTRLQFLSLGDRDTYGANIDDVSVVTVPEPFSVLGLGAVGLVGAAGALRKRLTA
ncbi:MAG: PEP-CTERM sorting domain-containing protein [Leptolyngbya sp. RL_3_1]|nr:PEP-CTERM sorting domain-containing protein [Leptolyngbya sp. RL_3_1]